jgi:HSF-type DNA-binding
MIVKDLDNRQFGVPGLPMNQRHSMDDDGDLSASRTSSEYDGDGGINVDRAEGADRMCNTKFGGTTGDDDDDDSNPEKLISASQIIEYRDFSRDRPDTSMGGNTSFGREGSTQTFPMKLHSILSHPEFLDIIAWLPHGRGWRILQMKAFEERAIPLYFRYVVVFF